MTNPFRRLWAWLTPLSAKPGPAPGVTPPAKKKLNISLEAQARARQAPTPDERAVPKAYVPPPGVLPKDVAPAKMAMDFDGAAYGYIQGLQAGWGGAAFQGYQYLSLLQQQPEYRKITEVLATEATRKWVRLTSQGDDDKQEVLDKLEKAMERFRLRALFRAMAEMDGFFGRGQLFIDVKKPNDKTPTLMTDPELSTPLALDKAKITKDSLIGFRPVEPVWTYPGRYDSSNPLSPHFYRPRSWYVMGAEIHASRLLTFISRTVPDLLKASYNFGGLSMSQMAEPYIANWLRTRDSVSDVVRSFSLNGVKTDLGSTLTEGDSGEQLYRRLDMFNQMRDNRGMMALDKDTEDFFQFNTPLSGLDKLQAQAQEQMSSVSGIPLVKLLGVTPSGLNASSDGEIRVFYDYVKSYQENFMRDRLAYCLDVIQLSEFGAIDEDIGFEFEPLWESDGLEAAQIRKADADTAAVLLDCGAISPEDIRNQLVNDPGSAYHGLEANADVDDTPGGEPEPPPVIAQPGKPAANAATAKPAAKAA